MCEELLERMKEYDYNGHMIRLAKELIIEMQKRGVHNVEKFVSRLKRNVHDKGEHLDILKEGRFAVVLAKNNFSEIHVEYCKEKGPDIRANWNKNTIYFEVARFRPGDDDKKIASFGGGAPEKVISKIQHELDHMQNGKINIVVLLSDTRNATVQTLEEALKFIDQEICENPVMYGKMSGILFAETAEALYPVRFHLFINRKALKPLVPRLTTKLNSMRGTNPKRLQKQSVALAKSLREVMNKEESNKKGDT